MSSWPQTSGLPEIEVPPSWGRLNHEPDRPSPPNETASQGTEGKVESVGSWGCKSARARGSWATTIVAGSGVRRSNLDNVRRQYATSPRDLRPDPNSPS